MRSMLNGREAIVQPEQPLDRPPAPPAARLLAALRRVPLTVWALGLFALALGMFSPLAALLGVALMLGMLLGVWLIMPVNQIGQVLGGWLAGSRLALLAAGPITVTQAGGRLRLSLDRSRPALSGMVLCIPRTDHLVRNASMMLAGGPLASIVVGVLALSSLLWLRNALLIPLALFGVFNLFTGVMLLVPQQGEGVFNPGARLRMLRRGDGLGRRYCAVLTLLSLTDRQRPRAWSPEVLAAALALPDYSIDDFDAHLYAYSAALDRGQQDVALAHISYILAHLDSCAAAARAPFLLEAAYFAARRGDPLAARASCDQARGGLLPRPLLRPRAEAAVLLAEGRPAQAAAAARAGLAMLEREEPTPTVAFEAELLRELLRQSEAVLR